MGAKKQVDDAYTGTGNTIIDEHITVLSNQARDLKDNLEKIDKEFDNNRGKLANIEVEDKNCRKQLAQALEIAKNAWDPSTGIKTRQRNLVCLPTIWYWTVLTPYVGQEAAATRGAAQYEVGRVAVKKRISGKEIVTCTVG